MNEKASIPILGIDERPNERQTTPGLATDLNNLKPTGLTDEPEWEPVEHPDQLKNTAGTAYTPGNDVERVYWHVRGRVGKNGDSNGSLRRLVVITNTGIVKVIDPDLGLGWSEVVSYQVASADSGEWDMHLYQMYDIGYITVTKGGVPQQDLILEDDLLIEFEFPELPIVRTFLTPSDDDYTPEELEGGETAGLLQGGVFVRYAFRLSGGVLVKHSQPEKVQTSVLTSATTAHSSILNFYLEGYGQTAEPSNFAFWKDKIQGVTILVSEYKAAILGSSSLRAAIKHEEDHLRETVWYELDTFDFIDTADAADDDLVITTEIDEAGISALPTADVDDNTHHRKMHGSGITYNSRLLLGRERIDFGLPALNQKEGINNSFVYVHHDMTGSEFPNPFLVIYSESASAPTISGDVNVTVTLHPQVGGQFYICEYDTTGSGWEFQIDITANFFVTINDTVVSDYDHKVLPQVRYNYTQILDGSELLKLTVELDTDTGVYERTLAEGKQVYTEGDTWRPQGGYFGAVPISYPDGRAIKIHIYVYDTGATTYWLLKTLNLKSAIRGNYAFKYTTAIDVTDTTAESPDDSGNAKSEYVANKVVASVINSPLAFESDLVYVIGRSNEPVTGFAVNALAVSEGQFGQYPLYVFKNEAIYALEQSQGADVVFGRITPIDVSMGVADDRKIVNVGQSIVFSNESGIYFLQGAETKKFSDAVRSILGNIKALGYLRSDDDEELIVSTGTTIYRYSMKYGRWYTSDGAEQYGSFFTDNEKLYGLSEAHGAEDALVTDFQSPDGQVISWNVLLEDIHFGLPDTLKRFMLFYLRAKQTGDAALSAFDIIFGSKTFAGTTDKNRPKWKSVYDCGIEITGTGTKDNTKIHKIDTEFKVRYPRKQRS